jgi:hypothetical protein
MSSKARQKKEVWGGDLRKAFSCLYFWVPNTDQLHYFAECRFVIALLVLGDGQNECT